MQKKFADQLQSAFSSERLGAYSKRLSSPTNDDLFAHYVWNIALSESLYPSLHLLEVVLRNTIHSAASKHFRLQDWFINKPGRVQVINKQDIRMVEKAKKELIKNNKELDPHRYVAELSFGFWTALLDVRYENDQILWPGLLKPCFPYIPRRLRTRSDISKRFEAIRKLRNRVFHHEPIWCWTYNSKDLLQQHKEILEAIDWIKPEVADLVKVIDRFPFVHQHGLSEIKRNLSPF